MKANLILKSEAKAKYTAELEWRVGKGVVSQVSLDQSITKRQQTDKTVKRTENITAIALEWRFVLPTLFANKHCQFLYSDYCGVLFLFFQVSCLLCVNVCLNFY